MGEQDIRWQQRLENLSKALSRLQEAVLGVDKEPHNRLYQIALVTCFQFTFELSWKVIKDYLNHTGVAVSLPREVIKQASHHQIVQDKQTWIDMLESRHILVQIYQESPLDQIKETIKKRYFPAIQQIHRKLDLPKKEVEA
jgi:nucleotidyltransferase substrate binding protein (TIGR01987 family)